MVERFNGRIEDVLQSHRFQSGEDLEQTILRYVTLYNQQLPQAALASRTPLQTMKDWHKLRPDLFKKQPYYLTGCDTYSKDGGFGYSTTANTLDAARQIAMQQCLNFNEQCRIIAEIIPVGYRPPGPGDITVSPVIADLIRDARSQPQFRAMAISEEGAYSYVWGHKNQENANRAAIAHCDSHIDPNLLGTSIGLCILVPGVGF